MKKRNFRYDEGGEVTEMEEGSGGYGALSEPEPAAEKPKAKPKTKSKTPGGAPVAGRPRGESGPVSVTRQMADRAAADAMNARSASETRAAKAREDDAEKRRESRGATPPGTSPKRGTISTAGVNPKTLMPSYAKGGSVKGSGCEQRGLRKCKVI